MLQCLCIDYTLYLTPCSTLNDWSIGDVVSIACIRMIDFVRTFERILAMISLAGSHTFLIIAAWQKYSSPDAWFLLVFLAMKSSTPGIRPFHSPSFLVNHLEFF